MKIKKNILFVIPTFGIGGTTVSTKNLIMILEKEGYQTNVLCLSGEGILQEMYNGITQIPSDFIAHSLSLQGWRDHKGRLSAFGVMILRFVSNHSRKIKDALIKTSIKKILSQEHYDTVVACEEGFSTYYSSFINCSNKVAWVRCDYKRYIEETGSPLDTSYYCYNSIVCVAQNPCDNFKILYPDLSERIYCINNPQDSNMIIEGSKNNDYDCRYTKDSFTIVSVGRFDKVKRFDTIPAIAHKLKDDGLNFIWYVIGDGNPGRDEIETKIREYGVSDCVLLLGYKTNPHYYIANADLLVCLSYSEACPRVINEAKVLGTPTVSTTFPSVYDFIEDGKDGLIREIDDIPQAITEMIKDKELYNRITSTLSNFQFDNSKIIYELKQIL